MELTITEHTDKTASRTLALAGSIDLSTREAFLDAGRAALRRGASLRLDMAEVNFIDSAGIGALLELARVARANDAYMSISPRSARVNRVLEITGLDTLWAATDSSTSPV